MDDLKKSSVWYDKRSKIEKTVPFSNHISSPIVVSLSSAANTFQSVCDRRADDTLAASAEPHSSPNSFSFRAVKPITINIIVRVLDSA